MVPSISSTAISSLQHLVINPFAMKMRFQRPAVQDQQRGRPFE